jgi:hypothetical protein
MPWWENTDFRAVTTLVEVVDVNFSTSMYLEK